MTTSCTDPQNAQSPQSTKPTHVRHGVIVFAVTLAVITYIDRVCIAQAAPDIQRELGFSKEQMGWGFFAFLLAYGLFEIPAGWMGDKFGPRRTLMRVVLMWSTFTAATGMAWNLSSMIVCRFFFGAGEAGCFPNVTKAFKTWLPPRERVRAQGFMWLSARWGGAFTPLMVVWVMSFTTWRNAFMIFAGLGVVWAFVFYRWFRDHPRNHPGINAAELAMLPDADSQAAGHGDVPWRRFFSSPTVWLLWLQFFCINYGWYFYITWLPTYLVEARGVTLEKGALLAGLPLFFGGLGSLFTGLVSERAAIWFGSTARARRWLAFTGLATAAVMLVASTRVDNATFAMVLLGIAAFSNDLCMPGAWGACMDVGGRYVGSLSGSMNMMGQFGGMVCPVVVPQVLKYTGNNWTMVFWLAGAAYVVAAISWLFIDPVTSLDRKSSAPAK